MGSLREIQQSKGLFLGNFGASRMLGVSRASLTADHDEARLAATSATAPTIPSYPVHRHRFPDSAIRIWSWVGAGLSASSAVAETSIPGVQNPHWTAPCRRN